MGPGDGGNGGQSFASGVRVQVGCFMSQAVPGPKIDGSGKLRHGLAMLGKAIKTLQRALLLVALTVAPVATGFAHRVPMAADQGLALALANGATLDDLCADAGAGDRHSGPGCLACRIAGAADLPPAQGDLRKLDLVAVAEVTAPRESRIVPPVLDPSNAPQGPPTA